MTTARFTIGSIRYTLHGGKWDTWGQMGRFFSLRTLRPLRLKKGFNRRERKGYAKPNFHTVFSITDFRVGTKTGRRLPTGKLVN